MQDWLPFFVAVTALAVVLQMAILAAMYFQIRRMSEQMTRILGDFQSRMNPILTRLQMLLEDTQPRLSGMVADVSEIVHLARGQAQKVDRVFTEAVDRLRVQLIHADQILSGTIEAVEVAGSKIRRTVLGPVQQASALIKGIQAGLEFFRARGRGREGAADQDEGLFI
ncbi:MAG TPA: hypothetical protein VI699_11110 [Candidatus Acidoferrales bacterium]|nr:hypothetical protein [Candidatus Acidoferrales bacterium]